MRRSIYTLLFMLVSGITSGQALHRIENNGLHGYADSAGNEIIKPMYDFVFTDTLCHIAFVYKDKCIIGIDRENNQLFEVFNYDNGPDYISEGLFRIVDDRNLIGYADTLGKIIITPKYKFAYPFKDMRAEVTQEGRKKRVGEHWYWRSKHWFYIKHPSPSKN